MIHPDTKMYLSEDYAFCKRAIQAGFKIHVRTDIDLSHIGHHYYKGNIKSVLTTVNPTESLKVEKKLETTA